MTGDRCYLFLFQFQHFLLQASIFVNFLLQAQRNVCYIYSAVTSYSNATIITRSIANVQTLLVCSDNLCTL